MYVLIKWGKRALKSKGYLFSLILRVIPVWITSNASGDHDLFFCTLNGPMLGLTTRTLSQESKAQKFSFLNGNTLAFYPETQKFYCMTHDFQLYKGRLEKETTNVIKIKHLVKVKWTTQRLALMQETMSDWYVNYMHLYADKTSLTSNLLWC